MATSVCPGVATAVHTVTHPHGQAPHLEPLLPARTHLFLFSEKLNWKKQAVPQWGFPTSAGWPGYLHNPISSPSQDAHSPSLKRPRGL